MNFDSDGVINGQVLTVDIENIVELDFSNQYINFTYGIITGFSGIEDFIALEILKSIHPGNINIIYYRIA